TRESPEDDVNLAIPQELGDRTSRELGLRTAKHGGEVHRLLPTDQPQLGDDEIEIPQGFRGPSLEATVGTGARDRLAAEAGQLRDLLGRQDFAQLTQLVEWRLEVERCHGIEDTDTHDLPHIFLHRKSHMLESGKPD